MALIFTPIPDTTQRTCMMHFDDGARCCSLRAAFDAHLDEITFGGLCAQCALLLAHGVNDDTRMDS